jgi:antitoxin HicB
MIYHFKYQKDARGGYWAKCVELNGCRTEADTFKELEKNMSEVLNLYLAEPEDSKTIFPLPSKTPKGRYIVAVSVDSNVAFAMLLRQTRLKVGLTQQKAAKLLGMPNTSSYQRLERAKTANPELRTLKRITQVFPRFRIDPILSVRKKSQSRP